MHEIKDVLNDFNEGKCTLSVSLCRKTSLISTVYRISEKKKDMINQVKSLDDNTDKHELKNEIERLFNNKEEEICSDKDEMLMYLKLSI